MIFLLDTDLLIFLIRGLKANDRTEKHRQAVKLMNRCQESQAAGHSVGLSAITVAELEFGARHSRDYDKEIAAVRKILMPFELYDFDAVASPIHYGEVRHDLESTGKNIGAMDTLIAAHALALGGTLVTNNTAHFSRVRWLNVLNWLHGGI